MKQYLIIFLALLFLSSFTSDALANSCQLEFRMASKNPVKPSKAYVIMSQPGTLPDLYVSPVGTLSNDNILSAQIYENDPTRIEIKLNDYSTNSYHTFTKKNRFQRLAVILDGKVITAFSIRAVVDTGQIYLSGLPEETVANLARCINQESDATK